MNRTNILTHTRTAVRIVLYSTLGTAVIAGMGFVGTHLYLETKDPTPSAWPQKTRFAFRAAVFNKEYLDQPDAAKADLMSVLESLKSLERSTSPDASTEVPSNLKLGQPGRRRDSTADCDEGLAKVLLLLGDIEKKQGHLQEALEKYEEALPHTIFNMLLQSSAARRMGEIQERFGLLKKAQSSFDLAVQSLLPHYQSGSALKIDGTVKYSVEMIDSVKALALFRGRQGRFQDSLSTLMSILHFQRQHPAIPAQSCETASTMANIAELVLALGDPAECRRWCQESLAICLSTKNKDKRYCLECAGIDYNMIGLLELKQGDIQEARMNFGRATILAERAGDLAGLSAYSDNMDRCK